MPRILLSAEQRKINTNLSQLKYRMNNREKLNTKSKLFYQANRDSVLEYHEIYRDTHKEERKIYQQTPAGIKANQLAQWNFRGITFGEMTPSFFYDVIYLPATICMSCEKVFDKDIKNNLKCCDHNGKLPTDHPLYLCNVRGVICFACNIQDNWKKRLTPNSIFNQYLKQNIK